MKDLIAKLQMDANCALGAIWMHIDAQAARIAELEVENGNLAYELNVAQSGGSVAILAAASATVAEQDADIPEALTLLASVFDAWENGDDCYEDPEEYAGFLGKAFRLDDDIFNRCVELLNRRNPPRNAALQPADTDKLREAIANISNNQITEAWESCGGVDGFYKSFGYQQFAHAILDLAADTVASTALQAPVGDGIANDTAAVQANLDGNRLQAPVREVPGWQLVPIEPTHEMVWAARAKGTASTKAEIWSAMLAAAPLPAVPVQPWESK